MRNSVAEIECNNLGDAKWKQRCATVFYHVNVMQVRPATPTIDETSDYVIYVIT